MVERVGMVSTHTYASVLVDGQETTAAQVRGI